MPTELARLMTLEMGKPVTQAKGEVELSAAIFEYYATKGPDLLADEILDIAGSGKAIVRTAPIGALLGIMPWNFPYYQAARFVAPNLLLGNTILLKHAANCPQQALRLAELLEAAGAPAGVYQNVFATTDQVATMIASPLLQGVSLTGSERAGSAVGELAGRHMKKAVLELGGSDPFIVLPGADIDNAVSAAVAGRFGNAGQVCTSSKRMIVESSVFDEFLRRVRRQGRRVAARRSDERGHQAGTDGLAGGPHRSHRSGRGRRRQGRHRFTSAAQVPDGPGAFYPATVLTGVTPEMRAYHEELFGPVAVLYQVDSVDEAIALANDSPYGLGSAVFTGDLDQADDVANRLDVGMVGRQHHRQERTGPAVRRSEELRHRTRTRPLRPRRVRQQEARPHHLSNRRNHARS